MADHQPAVYDAVFGRARRPDLFVHFQNSLPSTTGIVVRTRLIGSGFFALMVLDVRKIDVHDAVE
jgi:hypothetical protein